MEENAYEEEQRKWMHTRRIRRRQRSKAHEEEAVAEKQGGGLGRGARQRSKE